MGYYLNRMFIQILNMGITASYCIAAVLAIRLFFRRAPRKYLYVLWLVVGFRLICPVSVSTEFSLFNLDNFSQSVSSSGNGNMEYIPEHITQMKEPQIHTGVKAADALVNTGLSRTLALYPEGISMKDLQHADGRYRELAAAALYVGKYVWAFGVLVFLVYFAVSLHRMRQRVRMAVKAEPDGAGWRGQAGESASLDRESGAFDAEPAGAGRKSGSFGTVPGRKRWYDPGYAQVYECGGLSSPFTMGFFRPGIYLPCHLNGQQRKMILLHEQYHIHRRDHLVKLFSFCLLAFYWFHPLVWAAWICMCRDMEMSCDEKVLEVLGEGQKKKYCQTLLAFAVDRHSGSRMPLAFGEHDVENRIRHNLRFKKPALWAGVLAAAAIVAVLIVFGTDRRQQEDTAVSENQTGEEIGRQEDTADAAQLLYEARNPYVGDAPANGRLLGVIVSARPDSIFAGLSFKTELQTSAEPYEFHFLLEENGESLTVDEADAPELDAEMQTVSVLMLALIDNLGEVQWFYTTTTPDGSINDMVNYCDAQQAADWCGVENIKSYGESPEKVKELLNILKEREQDPGTASDDREEFEQWYAALPYELYEQAVPYEETEGSYTAYYDRNEDFMTVLAQTPDRTATVYGCYSRKYGTRGLTVDFRAGADGDSNHNYMDVVWDADDPGCQAAAADYDGDGRDEIALKWVSGRGVGAHEERLVVFETYDTGTLEPYEFTYDQISSELGRMVSASIDTENDLIQVLDGTSPESSVPLMSIPYDDKDGLNRILDVELLSWYQFQTDSGLALWVEPGILMKGWPGVQYLPQENGDDSVLMFHIQYDPSSGPDGGYFTLAF